MAAQQPPCTYVLSTDVGRVRLSIGDNKIDEAGAGVKPDGDNFTDEELQFFIDQAGSWRMAVPSILRTLANLFASQADRLDLEEYSEAFTKTVDNLLKAADAWEAKNATQDTPQAAGLAAVEAQAMFTTTQWGARATED